jgi:uncharacterized flavoprotein (TIGR03862 family)
LNNITIIGGGSASLFFASFLDAKKFNINIFEQKSAGLGRKFLVAGDGGFNLTHSENIEDLIERYTPTSFLLDALQFFNNQQFIHWLKDIGIPTFIGTSKRVYPIKGIKPIQVLNAIQSVLENKNVSFHFNKTFTGWNEKNNPVFNNDEVIESDYCIYALGGGSWKITGSNGNWLQTFKEKGISTINFEASNCAFKINWDAAFIEKNEGTPLKNIAITAKGKTQKGEVVITKIGIEGNAIYALSPEIRTQLHSKKSADIFLDLKPMLTEAQILTKLQKPSKNISNSLKNVVKLNPVQIQLIKTNLDKAEFTDLKKLAFAIKNIPLLITNAAPIDEAISTVGGIDLSEVNTNFELHKIPHHFCVGEMLDWDAPTGGYLLQACASMGAYLADHLNNKF